MKFLNTERKKFKDAFNGIYLFFSSAQHAKFHLFAAIIVIIAGCFFKVTSTEWVLLIICIGIVFFAEAVNESIERIADFIHKDHNPEIGKIKDIAAGAVLMAAIVSAIIGSIIFLPKILEIL